MQIKLGVKTNQGKQVMISRFLKLFMVALVAVVGIFALSIAVNAYTRQAPVKRQNAAIVDRSMSTSRAAQAVAPAVANGNFRPNNNYPLRRAAVAVRQGTDFSPDPKMVQRQTRSQLDAALRQRADFQQTSELGHPEIEILDTRTMLFEDQLKSEANHAAFRCNT